MLTSIGDSETPYAALVGEAWASLPAGVRRSHTVPLVASGTLRVSGPDSLLGGLVAKFAKLPPAGDCVVATLHARRRGERVFWERTFGDMRAVSDHVVGESCFIERAGPYTILIRPKVENGMLIHRQVGLRIFGIPMPKLFGPRVSGVVSAGQSDVSWNIAIRIANPVAGVLCSYVGEMTAK